MHIDDLSRGTFVDSVMVSVRVRVRVRVVCFSLQVMYLTNLSVIN